MLFPLCAPDLGLVHNMTLAPRASQKVFFTSQFFDNLIGWTLANAHDTTLEYKLSLFQRHPDAHDTTLAQVSYCEPGDTFASQTHRDHARVPHDHCLCSIAEITVKRIVTHGFLNMHIFKPFVY